MHYVLILSLATFDIPYPEGFGPLKTTYINNFSLFIGNGKSGKYTIQAFSIEAWSDLQLDLWDEPPVKLEQVTLEAGYKSRDGFSFTFGAQLKIDQHSLSTSVSYGVLPYGGLSSGAGNSGGMKETKGWLVQATYEGDIDLLAIVKKLTLQDVGGELSSMNVRNLSADKDKGIVIRNLTFSIQKTTSGGAIYISADTDWAVFEHIEFAATFYGPNSWGFSLSMDLKDDLLSLIPVEFIKDFSEYVKVNDTIVALYVGVVQPQEAGPTRKKLQPRPGSRSIGPSSGVELGLAVSTKLKMTDKLGILKSWIDDGELEIEGHISTKSVGLSAKAPKKIRLCQNKDTGKYNIEITGRLGVTAGPGFEITLSADMDIQCPLVTKDPIKFRNTGFALNAQGGVGFQGEIEGTLRDIFGLEGLEVRGLSVKALFSVAEPGMPEELMLTGGLTLKGAGNLNSQ
jgi:hypothetical protein